MDGFIQLIVFNIGQDELAVDIRYVQEIIRKINITRVPYSPPYITGVINLRGTVIPVMDVSKRFNIAAGEYGDNSRIIILDFKNSSLGLFVNSVSEVLKLPKQNIDVPTVFPSDFASDDIDGIGKMNDRVMMILSVEKLFETNTSDEKNERGIIGASV